METLRIEGLSKYFGGVQALQNVSFIVRRGERLAIIGPNGAGKTTLFSLLTGQLSATAGRICAFGQDITTMAPHRRAHLGLGRSFQVASLFPNLTVLDNVLLGLQGTKPFRFQMLRSISAYEDLFGEAEELLKSMSLWEKREATVQDISYGEQRKLEIALSLASKPKVLLLDEPTCGLTAAESADVIHTACSAGPDITLIIVAHDMDLVFGVAERIIVLHYGEIVAEGTPDEIKANSRVREVYMGIEEGTENAGVA